MIAKNFCGESIAMHLISLNLFSSFPRRRESSSPWAVLLAPVLLAFTSAACVGADTQGPADDRIACDGGVMACAAYDGCVAGYCDNSCFDHEDCNPGNLCAGYECVSEDAPLDLPPEDLFVEYGETLGEVTWTGCILHVDCGSGEMCDAGVCVDADGPIVDWDDPEAEYGLRTRLVLTASPVDSLSKTTPGVTCGAYGPDTSGMIGLYVVDVSTGDLSIRDISYELDESPACRAVERTNTGYFVVVQGDSNTFSLQLSSTGDILERDDIWTSSDSIGAGLVRVFFGANGEMLALATSTGQTSFAPSVGASWEPWGDVTVNDPVLSFSDGRWLATSGWEPGFELVRSGGTEWHAGPPGYTGVLAVAGLREGTVEWYALDADGYLDVLSYDLSSEEWVTEWDDLTVLGGGNTVFASTVGSGQHGFLAWSQSERMGSLVLLDAVGSVPSVFALPGQQISPRSGNFLLDLALTRRNDNIWVFESLGLGDENGWLWSRGEVAPL